MAIENTNQTNIFIDEFEAKEYFQPFKSARKFGFFEINQIEKDGKKIGLDRANNGRMQDFVSGGFIWSVDIDQKYRGMGLAKKIFEQCLEQYKEKNGKYPELILDKWWHISYKPEDKNTNLEIFDQVFKQTADIEKSVFSTPVGKIMKQFGYRLEDVKIYEGDIVNIKPKTVFLSFRKK